MKMIDLVLLKRNMLKGVLDVRRLKEMERGLSGHCVALSKVRLVSRWLKRRE